MSYQRAIHDKHPVVFVEVNTFPQDDLTGWLEKQAREQHLTCLLAHATNGVIWGRADENGRLVTSYDALRATQGQSKWDTYRIETAKKNLPQLRLETLQQARLFSAGAELFIWRDGDGAWNGRLLRDAAAGETPDWSESFDEPQLLWGTHGTRLEHGFTLLEDGEQGLYHAVPVEVTFIEEANGKLKQSVRLNIRHYLAYDEQGQAYIALSRLVDLQKT